MSQRFVAALALGLKNLDTGRYRLRLEVTGGGQTTSAEARLVIVK